MLSNISQNESNVNPLNADEYQNKLNYALQFSEMGFFILPCTPKAKNPKKGHAWGVGATRDPDIIKAWFEKNPDMNYGVCPRGKGFIIDLDIKKDGTKGEDRWNEILLTENQHSPETLIVRTPSGGKHIYFDCDQEVSNSHDFGKHCGIDVRGTSGYVVGPGCEIDYGHYEGSYEIIEDRPIAKAPDWLVTKYLRKPGHKDEFNDVPLIELDQQVNIDKATDFLKTHPPAIEGMEGNNHTFYTASRVKDFGVSEEKALELLFSSGWNNRCEPPWTPQELTKCVENAYRYGQNRPGVDPDNITPVMDAIDEKLAAKLGIDCDGNITNPVDVNNADNIPSTASGIKYFNAQDFMKFGKRREFIVPKWLPAHGFTALLGNRGSGKSTIMLDLACRLACDMDWYDFPMKKDYVTIYLCGEDEHGLKANMEAWQKKYCVTIPEDRMIVADGIPNLKSAGNVKKCLQSIRNIIGTDRKCIVFLDTWQRATLGTSQINDEQMQICVHNAEQLAKTLDGPLVAAFHPPKDGSNTIMGSSIIENTSAAIWYLEEQAPTYVKLKVNRVKGAERGNYKEFRFNKLITGEHDEFGIPESAIVPISLGGSRIDEAERQDEEQRKLLAPLIRKLMEGNGEKSWSVNAVATALEKVDNMQSRSKLSEVLPWIFRENFLFDDGKILSLFDTGKTKNGGKVKEFKLDSPEI